MRQITLQEEDIKTFEGMVNALPCFPKTVSENMAVTQAVQQLMTFMGSKLTEVSDAPEPAPDAKA
jgi:hypothetical protein